MRKTLLLIFLLFSPLMGQDIPAQIDSINALGKEYIFSNINRSISLYRETIVTAKKAKYLKGEAQALENLAIALYLKGEYDESVEAYLEAIRIYESLGMNEALAKAYGEFGFHMKRRDLPRAQKYMRQAMQIALQGNFQKDLCAIYDNYGVLKELNSELDSARIYYEKSLQLKTAMGDTFGIPFSLEKLAGVYTEWGDYQRASEYLREVTRYREKEKGHYGRLVVTVLWGDLYFKKGQLDSAITFYKRVMQMPGASEQKYLLSYCFKQLRQIYEQRQDYKSAYEFLQQAMAYNDSMVNVETNRRIAELETEFESEKKDRQLAEFQLKLVKHNRLQIIMVGLIVILILGVFGLYKYQQLKRRQIQRESEIRNQLKQKEYEQKFTDEKLRIARELHDNIGSQLTFLIGSLDTIHYYDGGILKNRLTSLRDFTKKTLNELRNTVWAMKQESSGVEALLIRLNELKSQMNEYIPRISLEIRSEVNGAVSLSSEKMLNLFRISQEAVQNAVKHSDATRISINIKAENAKLYLSIWNNGSGFDLSKVTHGSGLAHMQQRCQACKGQFNIVSDQTGTEVQCVFPLD